MAPTESHHGIPKEVPRQEENHLENRAAKGVSRVLQMFKVATDHDFQISYYTPEQKPVAGTALSMKDGSDKIPKLFQPLKLRGLTLQNRVAVSLQSNMITQNRV